MDILSYLLFFAPFGIHTSSRSQKRTTLLNDLLFNASTNLRPGLEYDRPWNVEIYFELVHMTEFNEVRGYISVLGYFGVVWFDERMTWDPYDYGGIEEMFMPSEKVFIPKLIIPNGFERVYALHEITGTEVMYSFRGEAYWETGALIKTRCTVHVQVYPFGEPYCFIEVSPMKESFGEVFSELVLHSPSTSFGTKHFRGNAEWELIETFSAIEFPDRNSDYTMVIFDMTFRRKPTFIIFNIIIPLYILSVMNTVVFLLPQSGERVSVSVAVLLFFALLLDVIGKLIPRTASPLPYLCYYAITVYVNSGVITFLVILFEKLYHNQGNRSVPRWLHISLRCLESNRQQLVSGVLTKRKHTPSENNDNVTKLELENVTEPELVNVVKPELVNWKRAIVKLNRIMFVFCFTTVNIFFIIYMVLSGFRIKL